MNYTAYTDYVTNGQMHVYLIASSIKIITKHNVFAICTDSSQPGWFHVDTYMCVFGLWFADTPATKILAHDDTSQIAKYVTFYAWTNRLTHFLSVIFQ